MSRPSRGWTRLIGISVGVGLGTAAFLVAYEVHRRKRRQPVSLDRWDRALESNSLIELDGVVQAIAMLGLGPEARAAAWPFLLRVFELEQDQEAVAAETARLRAECTRLSDKCQELDFEHQEYCLQTAAGQRNGPLPCSSTAPPHARFAEAQRAIVLDALRTRFPSPQKPDGAEDDGLSEARQSLQDGLMHSGLPVRQRKGLLRLVNLLCTYAVHDPDTGYCQGMSDLAVPFVVAFDDDAMAFWSFAAFMASTRANFRHDGSGIREQLQDLSEIVDRADPKLMQRLRQLDSGECHFAYRMVLVKLRRELTLAQAMRLWEIAWAHELLATRLGRRRPEKSLSARCITPVERPSRPRGLLACAIAAAVLRQAPRVHRACRNADDVLALFSLHRAQLGPTLALARKLAG